jgi:hypothetical protein
MLVSHRLKHRIWDLHAVHFEHVEVGVKLHRVQYRPYNLHPRILIFLVSLACLCSFVDVFDTCPETVKLDRGNFTAGIKAALVDIVKFVKRDHFELVLKSVSVWLFCPQRLGATLALSCSAITPFSPACKRFLFSFDTYSGRMVSLTCLQWMAGVAAASNVRRLRVGLWERDRCVEGPLGVSIGRWEMILGSDIVRFRFRPR